MALSEHPNDVRRTRAHAPYTHGEPAPRAEGYKASVGCGQTMTSYAEWVAKMAEQMHQKARERGLDRVGGRRATTDTASLDFVTAEEADEIGRRAGLKPPAGWS